MSVEAIIDELGGTQAVADKLGKEPSLVSNWRARGRIPSDWWPFLIEFAKEKRITGVTFDRLAKAQRPLVEARA